MREAEKTVDEGYKYVVDIDRLATLKLFYIKICVKTVAIMLLWLFFRNFAAKCATRSRKSICVYNEEV